MAQLVARLVRNEKVGGSNPPSSTTDRHPIRMSVFVCPGELSLRRAAGVPGAGGPAVGPGCSVCPWAAARWAGLLSVPVGGGPPASRPRRELRSARRLEARPGPATAHGHGSLALRTLRRPPRQWCLAADVWFDASTRCPARPHRRPPVRSMTRVKPSSPLLARALSPVKPSAPSRARYTYVRRYFGAQRRRRFHGGVLRSPHWC